MIRKNHVYLIARSQKTVQAFIRERHIVDHRNYTYVNNPDKLKSAERGSPFIILGDWEYKDVYLSQILEEARLRELKEIADISLKQTEE